MPRTPSVPRPYVKNHQLCVCLRDPRTGYRRTVYLGPPDSPEARSAYARAIGEWEAADRAVSPPAGRARRRARRAEPLTLTAVVVAYWIAIKPRHQQHGVLTTHGIAIRSALRHLRVHAGDQIAGDFGPLAFQDVRRAAAERGTLTRQTVNKWATCWRAALRWGVAQEMIPVSVVDAVACVAPLKRGEVPGLRENQKVMPVPQAAIDAVRPFVSRQVWALIRLQLCTGARPGELLGLRPVDIRKGESVWLVEPEHHKNAHRGKERLLGFGPDAQAVLRPFLHGRAVDAPLFSPREAELERKARGAAGRRRGGQPATPTKTPRALGDRYTPCSYARAIARACQSAGVTKWTPYRLRHTAATRIRRELGLETAGLVLGHGSARLTDEVYAQRDRQQLIRAMEAVG